MNVPRRSSPRDIRTSGGCGVVPALWAVALIIFMAGTRVIAADPTAPAASSPGTGFSGAAILEKAWPGHPEWLAMLADIIVKGEKISGGDGWFRRAVTQTRFDWKSVRTALDKDDDHSVSRAEFAGPDADFARLDRNRDGELTSPDFDFASQATGPSPGTLLFARADHDGTGKISPDEFSAFFTATDADGLGFLSLADLEQAFSHTSSSLRGSPGSLNGPTRWTFLKSFLRAELGAFPAGPAVNQMAPDFTLKSVNNRDEVTLSNCVGPRPVVLIFGNYTCRPFRAEAGDLEKLYQRYRDKATFLMIYVREAHPSDGWRMEVNDRLGVTVPQPRTYDERAGVARTCLKTLGLTFPMLVDRIDDPVNDRYSGIPSRLYLIDRLGMIAYKSGRGPFGFKPAELEQSLILLLERETTAATPPELSGTRSEGVTSGRPQGNSR